MRGLEPDRIHRHFVELASREYPVKQVLSAYTGAWGFQSAQAQRVMRKCGIEVRRSGL